MTSSKSKNWLPVICYFNISNTALESKFHSEFLRLEYRKKKGWIICLILGICLRPYTWMHLVSSDSCIQNARMHSNSLITLNCTLMQFVFCIFFLKLHFLSLSFVFCILVIISKEHNITSLTIGKLSEKTEKNSLIND